MASRVARRFDRFHRGERFGEIAFAGGGSVRFFDVIGRGGGQAFAIFAPKFVFFRRERFVDVFATGERERGQDGRVVDRFLRVAATRERFFVASEAFHFGRQRRNRVFHQRTERDDFLVPTERVGRAFARSRRFDRFHRRLRFFEVLRGRGGPRGFEERRSGGFRRSVFRRHAERERDGGQRVRVAIEPDGAVFEARNQLKVFDVALELGDRRVERAFQIGDRRKARFDFGGIAGIQLRKKKAAATAFSGAGAGSSVGAGAAASAAFASAALRAASASAALVSAALRAASASAAFASAA